jgi:hypothetical protein
LGLNHEHQNPYGGIILNVTAVYEIYSRPPNSWDPEKTKFNVIDRFNVTQTNGVYDPDSIMHYEIEPRITMNQCCGRKRNYDLSEGDKRTIQKLYGNFKESRGK